MTLHPKHLSEWTASTVAPEMARLNAWTIEDPAEVDQLLNRNQKRRWKHSTDLVPGWAVGGVDPRTGLKTLQGAQFKPDTPQERDGKKLKYLSPSGYTLSPLFLAVPFQPDYWPNAIATPTMAIAITEGAKKAAALLMAGIPAISIPGVATGGKLGRLRPELEAFCTYGRRFNLCFDRDIIDKRPVRQALHNLGRLLAAKGCVVYVVEWPNRFKGIDDYRAAGGDVHQRIEQAKTLEEWREEARERDPIDGETCTLARRYEMVASRLKGRLRMNTLKGRIEMDGEAVELSTLRIFLALNYNIQLPSEDANQIALYLAQQSSYSPIAAYLNEVATLYGPDSDLLDQVATTYLGTEEALHKCFMRKTLISAVARALTPGCKVDTVLMLQGPQGCGKSTFWKVLAGEEFFDDTVTNSGKDTDERLKLHQTWITEWAELETVFRRKDISALKAFVTTQTDKLRPPYGKDILELPRPSIIVGTTNETEFLSDPTGNRRFWVVPVVTPAIPLDQLAADRDRIWAAAVHAFKSGEAWVLPEDMRAVARADSENYISSDPWEEVVLGYADDCRQVTVSEVLVNALKLELSQMDKRAEMRVTKLLRQSGWGSSREAVHGRRVRVWKNPRFFYTDCPGCPEKGQSPIEQGGQPPGQPMGQPMGQPPENQSETPPPDRGLTEGGQLDNPDGYFPKSPGTQEGNLCPAPAPSIAVNDWVLINSPGSLNGQQVQVVKIDSDRAQVFREGWVVSQHYPLSQLRRIAVPHAVGV